MAFENRPGCTSPVALARERERITEKAVRFFAKVFLAVSAVTAVLFTIYMTNADSKLIEFIYDKLLHYHETKKVEDHI